MAAIVRPATINSRRWIFRRSRLFKTAASQTGNCACLFKRSRFVLQQRTYSRNSEIVNKLEEVHQRQKFSEYLRIHKETEVKNGTPLAHESTSTLTQQDADILVDASFATFLLHVESRIASALGKGFYTIGPCGEENMACLGLAARVSDPMALHYRHLASSIARQLKIGREMHQIMLDRARGYVCSTFDPVTGGRHCALGGTENDFYVTSTLASQAPPAVGRALGIGLANRLLGSSEESSAKFPLDSVSIVSVGDGSVNNSMFLSAANMADYARHRKFKCPVLFVVTNNDICISLRGYGWIDSFLDRQIMPVVRADGQHVIDVWNKTNFALDTVRQSGRPAFLVVDNLKRRFGHAGTDRQFAYLTETEIQENASANPIVELCEELVKLGHFSWTDLEKKWHALAEIAKEAFNEASLEPKIESREQALANLQSPLVEGTGIIFESSQDKKLSKPATMRVRMTDIIFEAMRSLNECVYVGEDVRHGGYYLVTDKLFETFPERVHDFPPDETMLIGVGMGYAHNGLLPIVEIPYAKYLDCAADMFFESVITSWCTNGKQPNGMIIRLQGFDKGVFGGNYHTHNSLHIPPGLDVVCYSNGSQYVRGMRYALTQAKAGRVVMSVDSTDLLNRRDLFPDEKDGLWMRPFPKNEESSMLTFDDVMLHSDPTSPLSYDEYGIKKKDKAGQDQKLDALVVTYGNGVPTALQAMVTLQDTIKIGVIDSPYLSCLPHGLEIVIEATRQRNGEFLPILFADVCKEGASPLTSFIGKLQAKGLLSKNWGITSASPTYNPLGCTATFLNQEDIINGIKKVTC